MARRKVSGQRLLALPEPPPPWTEGLADTRDGLFQQAWECIVSWSTLAESPVHYVHRTVFWDERLNAIGWKLLEIIPPAEAGMTQHGRPRDCCADWLDAVMDHHAAPFGTLPQYRGQRGRWVHESRDLGCRLDVHWAGMEGYTHVQAVDWELPFISNTGFYSLASSAPFGVEGPNEPLGVTLEKRIRWSLTQGGTLPLELEMIGPYEFTVHSGGKAMHNVKKRPDPEHHPEWAEGGFMAEWVKANPPPTWLLMSKPRLKSKKKGGRR